MDSRRPRTVLVVTVLVWAVLAPLVWRDLQSRDDEEVRGPKWLWRLASMNLTGVVAYALIGRKPRVTTGDGRP